MILNLTSVEERPGSYGLQALTAWFVYIGKA